MLDILYRDDSLVAVNKPSGLLVHRSMIDKNETIFAMQMVRDQIGQRVYPLHRLDRPTSGVLLFGLSREVAQRMGEQFETHSLSKEYIALIRGYCEEEAMIDYPLKEVLDKMTDSKANPNKEPQSAITHLRRLATVELPFGVGRYPTSRYSLVRLTPSTGRKHQLRRHMKHIFHPIVGDTKYGRTEHNNFFREQYGIHRLLLHAGMLSFTHPYTGEIVKIEAPFDGELKGLLERMGFDRKIFDFQL